jgi:hypothetical protein
MDQQAEVVNELRKEETPPPDFLARAWTYQTQTKQIEGPLARDLSARVERVGILP